MNTPSTSFLKFSGIDWYSRATVFRSGTHRTLVTRSVNSALVTRCSSLMGHINQNRQKGWTIQFKIPSSPLQWENHTKKYSWIERLPSEKRKTEQNVVNEPPSLVLASPRLYNSGKLLDKRILEGRYHSCAPAVSKKLKSTTGKAADLLCNVYVFVAYTQHAFDCHPFYHFGIKINSQRLAIEKLRGRSIHSQLRFCGIFQLHQNNTTQQFYLIITAPFFLDGSSIIHYWCKNVSNHTKIN